MPAMHLVRTVLPAPLSPHNAVTWPGGRSRSTRYSACTGPKCLSSSRTFSNGSSVARCSATAAGMSVALSRRAAGGRPARGGCGGLFFVYEGGMLWAVRRAAVTCAQSADAETNLSLITVEAMLALLTHIGTSRTAGCVLPVTPDGGAGG